MLHNAGTFLDSHKIIALDIKVKQVYLSPQNFIKRCCYN